jgi:hypothetical protein
LDSKYFLFFSKAYRRLYDIYEFSNKSTFRSSITTNYDNNKEHAKILSNFFDVQQDLKTPENFNNWFNQKFEKYRTDNPLEDGYAEWLKSNDGILETPENVNKSNMNAVFEQHKQRMQSLIPYTGVSESFSSLNGASLLDDAEHCSTEQYTDIKQAYTETLFPVTEDDFNKMPKYKDVNEYVKCRDTTDITPLSKEESEKILNTRNEYDDHASTRLAFKYAKKPSRTQNSNPVFGENSND